jgi:hypothetical protein
VAEEVHPADDNDKAATAAELYRSAIVHELDKLSEDIKSLKKNGAGPTDLVERTLRWTKLIFSIVGIVGGWALALTVWLVSMHADVTQEKFDINKLAERIERIDQQGTRALELIRQRQNDVVATNTSQDVRLRDIENKIGDMARIQLEIKYYVDQLFKSIGQQK